MATGWFCTKSAWVRVLGLPHAIFRARALPLPLPRTPSPHQHQLPAPLGSVLVGWLGLGGCCCGWGMQGYLLCPFCGWGSGGLWGAVVVEGPKWQCTAHVGAAIIVACNTLGGGCTDARVVECVLAVCLSVSLSHTALLTCKKGSKFYPNLGALARLALPAMLGFEAGAAWSALWGCNTSTWQQHKLAAALHCMWWAHNCQTGQTFDTHCAVWRCKGMVLHGEQL